MPKATGAQGNPGGQGAPVVQSPDVTAQVPTLKSLGITKRLSSEAQKLAKLPAERFSAILAGELTRKQAMARDTHIAQNTGVSEWYTPAEYIEAARALTSTRCSDLLPARAPIVITGYCRLCRVVSRGRQVSRPDQGPAPR